MNIVVCCKQISDPEAPPATFKIDPAINKVVPPPGVAPVISPFDENAVEAALKIKDSKPDTKIAILSLGLNLTRDVVKKPLAMGADELILLEDPAFDGGDSWSTATALAAAIKKLGNIDLVLCGRQAADWDAGQVGSGLGVMLGLPCVTLVKKIELQDGKAKVQRVITDGYQVIEVDLPAVLTISNEIGQPRYAALKGIMAAARKQPVIWKQADIGLEPSKVGAAGNNSKVSKLFQPVKEGKCEIIGGETPVEAGTNLAVKLREAKLI